MSLDTQYTYDAKNIYTTDQLHVLATCGITVITQREMEGLSQKTFWRPSALKLKVKSAILDTISYTSAKHRNCKYFPTTVSI